MDAIPSGFETVDCPGCGGKKWTPARQGIDHDIVPGTPLRIVRCDGCGLHFTNPRPMLPELGKYYPKDYSPYAGGEKGAPVNGTIGGLVLREAFGAPSVRPHGLPRVAARAVMLVKRPERFGFGLPYRGRGRLLDFGCGAGKFLRRMHALGWEVTGIDFSEAAVAAVRAAGIPAHQGTLPHTCLTPGSFDVVTMRHALEHVPDPPAVLRAARELLAPGGLLLVQVPNYACWDVDYFEGASLQLDLPRHFTHFTPGTLEQMLPREGFANVKVRQVCRANWIRKAALRAERGPKRRMAWIFRRMLPCRVMAAICQARGRGNEIIARAERGFSG